MRSILDSHPEIKCGAELKIIPDIANIADFWTSDKAAIANFKGSNVSTELINKLMSQFFYNLIHFHHNDSTQRLCNKDPNLMLQIKYLSTIFPNAKFVLMVRDPRGSVLSYLPRYKLAVNAANFDRIVMKWNEISFKMYFQCKHLGESHCIIVKYEDLVAKSKAEIKRILDFLGEKWHDNVMKHQELIGTEIELSRKEWSSEDIVKPINTLSLNTWSHLPFDPNVAVKKYAHNLFTMLKYTYETNHIQIDNEILKNNEKINKNKNYWIQKAKQFSDFVK